MKYQIGTTRSLMVVLLFTAVVLTEGVKAYFGKITPLPEIGKVMGGYLIEGQPLPCLLPTDVYRKGTEPCGMIPQVEKDDGLFAISIIKTTRVLDRVVAKNGQGCVEMTKGTWLPLDVKGCEDLFIKNERLKSVFIAKNGKVTVYPPIVKIGEEWFLYEDNNGKLTWKIPKG